MNIITIVLDTFRSDIIGPGKNLSFVRTPNLDKLAAESIVFDQAFGEGQPTLQVRRAFFTGRRSFPFVYNFDRRGHWHHAPGWHKIPPPSYADEYCPDYKGIDFIQPGPVDKMSDREIERTKALYFGEVTFVDRWVGHLIEKIETLGLKENTAIIVLSDHGTQVMDHGAFGKGGSNLRRYNTGIVWQMRLPRQEPMKIDALVQSHDVMPTMLEILGIPYDLTDGTSVMPLVRGETDEIRNPIVCGWALFSSGNAGAAASVRTKEWNYIREVQGTENQRLFDLTVDPNEDTDVAAEHPDVVSELEPYLEAVVGQPLPAKLNEVCDPQDSPIGDYLGAREKLEGSS